MAEFRKFFLMATDGREPYPFQERFATSDALPHLIRAPTGAGKTATAILGWLWRLKQKIPGTPRRLVYCLPMRVLVEQSAGEAKSWIENLKLDIETHVLMGGIDTEKWYLSPEKPAILIGTQDMLLSRALNRGYAASRFHWPIDFGLLNNDSLWIFDEPQLMGNGISTSAQLAGFRNDFGTFSNCQSIWMSATLEPNWLDTVDFRGKFTADPLELDEHDYSPKKPLYKRMTADKTLHSLGASSSKDMKDVGKAVLGKHVKETQTLVVVNTVDRAKALYEALQNILKKTKAVKLLLVHSRFRPLERENLNLQLQDKGDAASDRIIIATQVVEAGVDISARTLVTELAPWASVVQRIGRCNRTGDDFPGEVFWIDLDEKQFPPYLPAELDFARQQIEKLEGENVSPKALDEFKTKEQITLPFEHKHVLRRRDLLDLFDTSPDLSGNDIDIQRFVRSDEESPDVQVFWRDVDDGGPNDSEADPQCLELCNVPAGQELRNFIEKLAERRIYGFVWDYIEVKWNRLNPRQLRPGLTILFPIDAGGYSEGRGWDPTSTAVVKPYPPDKKTPLDAIESDINAAIPVAYTITEHTEHVCQELNDLLKCLGKLASDWHDHLAKSARWHDVGKALNVCQQTMQNTYSPDPARLLAKSGRNGRLDYAKYGRKYFRHELGSALAALQHDLPFCVAYLIAAHHGKVRLAIRALPGECLPKNEDIIFALGVHHGDELSEVDLGCETCSTTKLDLSPMRLGGEQSWTARALTLLGEIGPFRLAYLEMLLRAADVRASQKEAKSAIA